MLGFLDEHTLLMVVGRTVPYRKVSAHLDGTADVGSIAVVPQLVD